MKTRIIDSLVTIVTVTISYQISKLLFTNFIIQLITTVLLSLLLSFIFIILKDKLKN